MTIEIDPSLVAKEIAETGMARALKRARANIGCAVRLEVDWNTASATLRGLRSRGLIFRRPQKHLTPFGIRVLARLNEGVEP